jgi:Protein of unknown function DUF262
MKTAATNRSVGQLVKLIASKELVPRPDFQRRLVWSNSDKLKFLDTVLNGYPFPEIYIAVGDMDLDTAVGTEILVDGQQRISTLFQYFTASKLLKLSKDEMPYNDLSEGKKREFLGYSVAVRDLGIASAEQIREVFKRINSTAYSLNEMEIHNALYRGPLNGCAQKLAEGAFFEENKLFSSREAKRMRDVVYCLTILITMMSTYFNRDDDLEEYLERFNDEFPDEKAVTERFLACERFITKCNFQPKSRAWKKTDLLVLFVELDRILHKDKIALDATKVGPQLQSFYDAIDRELSLPTGDEDLTAYVRTTLQATNDRVSRVNRGRVLRKKILEVVNKAKISK